jgi:hypothetical protein
VLPVAVLPSRGGDRGRGRRAQPPDAEHRYPG